ncbi:MAG: hypothetical protein RLZZ546_3009 [Bacteroidota bacterium]|jgi:ribose 5-phosphate isomerase B
MKRLKITIGNDHAGFKYKKSISTYLEQLGHKVSDAGAHSEDSVDYPDFAHPVAKDVESKQADFGILICGSGNGVSITANKHQNIRAALCWKEEIAKLARSHNNANIICIPARFVSMKLAIKMTDVFINEKFEGGRHLKRVKKISC